jgi:hypothetical protein
LEGLGILDEMPYANDAGSPEVVDSAVSRALDGDAAPPSDSDEAMTGDDSISG